MKHVLPNLDYPKNALEPFMSEETLEYHYGKHHQGYLDKLNKLIMGTVYEKQDLDQITQTASGAIFNNAAQAWNHAFFWKCLTPEHHSISSSTLYTIEDNFESMDKFQTTFIKKGTEVFGSGWLWLVRDDSGLSLQATHDANNPLREGKQPLLTCDLWEHAYYIDYRNEREKYLEAFVEIINWDFVEGNLKAALKSAA